MAVAEQYEEWTLHDHCLSCYRVDCLGFNQNVEVASAVDLIRHGCPVIQCHNLCGAIMHTCKLEDHLSLCPVEVMPCVNYQHGCPHYMRRDQIAPHLITCCANVLVCSTTWNRKLVNNAAFNQLKRSKTAKQYLFSALQEQWSQQKHAVKLAPDIAFMLSDQRQLLLAHFCSKFVRKLFKNFFNKCHPVLPIQSWRKSATSAVVENLYDTSYDSEATLTSNEVELFEDSSEEDDPMKKGWRPPAVSQNCPRCRQDPTSQHFHIVGIEYSAEDDRKFLLSLMRKEESSKAPLPTFYAKWKILINRVHDVMPISQSKTKSQFTYSCGAKLRRDQYHQHMKHVHDEIMANIDQTICHRCPLFSEDCDVFCTNLVPDDGRSRVVFNGYLNSFTLASVMEAEPGLSMLKCIYLTQLPFEILKFVCELLDPASLYCLSATCRILRQACASQLDRKGIVELPWQRNESIDGRVYWLQGDPIWSFTKVFSPIRSWQVRSSVSLGSHVQQCSKYDPIVHNEPFQVMFKDS